MSDSDKELQRFQKDVEYFEANQEQLVRQHPNEWIAVFKESVIGASPSLDDLLDQLQADNMPIGHVFIKYASPKEEILILAIR